MDDTPTDAPEPTAAANADAAQPVADGAPGKAGGQPKSASSAGNRLLIAITIAIVLGALAGWLLPARWATFLEVTGTTAKLPSGVDGQHAREAAIAAMRAQLAGLPGVDTERIVVQNQEKSVTLRLPVPETADVGKARAALDIRLVAKTTTPVAGAQAPITWQWKAATGKRKVYRKRVLEIAFLGDLFLKMLKALVVPLVILSMIVGISGLGDVRKLGRLGSRTVLYYLTTTFIAVALGMLLVSIIQPGAGAEMSVSEAMKAKAQAKVGAASFTQEGLGIFEQLWNFVRDFSMRLVPSNLFDDMANNRILPLIVFSLFMGAVLTILPSGQGRPVLAVCESGFQALMHLIHWIMIIAPIGIFGLVAAKIGGTENLGVELSKLGWYIATVIIGLAVHAVIVLPMLLWIFTRRSPIAYARGMGKALITAFSTASSSATLPLTMEAAIEENGVSRKSTEFVLPLGATINMDGTALYEAVAVIFVAQANGFDLTAVQFGVIFITATLAAIGAAGIPEAGLVTMVMVFQAVGMPIEYMGLILAIDWFLDRCRTTVNVWGDAVGAAIMDRVALDEPPPEDAARAAA